MHAIDGGGNTNCKTLFLNIFFNIMQQADGFFGEMKQAISPFQSADNFIKKKQYLSSTYFN